MILSEPLYCRSSKRGSILILTLWTIFLLALLAVAVGSYLDGRLALARRIEQRTIGLYAARTGLTRSLVLLQQDTNAWAAQTGSWADNPNAFSNIVCGAGVYSVFHVRDSADGGSVTNFGLGDEHSKIDLNQARPELLKALFEEAGGLEPESAAKLADTVSRARTKPVDNSPGIGEPSPWKEGHIQRGRLESIQEAQWIKGMTDDVFSRIRDHVTVHGGGRVNLNTAGDMVLRTLVRVAGGADSRTQGNLIRKILQFRERGGIFKTYLGSGLVEALGPEARLTGDERSPLYGMAPFVAVGSDHFRGHVEGAPSGRLGESRRIDFVWDRKHHRIEFWHED